MYSGMEYKERKLKKESVKMKNKRLITLVCLLLAVAVILCSCGQTNQDESKKVSQEVEKEQQPKEEKADDESSKKDEGYSLPIVDEPVTLTFMCRENQTAAAPTYGSGELPVWQKAEELTGVKIEWETAISSDYEAVVQTRLAAGVDLPDMVCVPDPLPYLSQGLFIPLDDLIEKYAPDVKKMLDENPDVKASVTAYDGKIYCITQVPKEVNEVHTRILWIREDWLERLNLDMPKTIDDWYEVLKAFKEEDANGNGDKDDEFPMLSPNDTEIGNRAFAAAFDICYAYTDGYSVDENGKVRLDWIRPEAKEYMAFIKKLIDERLFIMVDQNERQMRLADNTAGSIDMFPDAIQGRNNLLRQEVPDGRFVACPAPSSKFGEGFYVTPQPSYGYETGIFITKNCDKPEIAMKWINFLFSPEGYLLTNFGIEGVSYIMENGKPKVTEYFTNNPDGLSSGEAQRFLGARPSFANFMSQDFEVQVKMTDPFIGPSVDIIKKYKKQPTFPQVMATADEIDVLKTIGTDLKTYVEENRDMFILGERPLQEFDDFVQEVKEMGLEEVLAIKQQQYERYKKFTGQ